MSIVDIHGRPTPMFYELPIKERAFVIQNERTNYYLQRAYMDVVERMRDAFTYMDLEDSIRSLDMLAIPEAAQRYQRILMGAY